MPAETSRTRSILAHESLWGPPDLIARAPGRVNLIGEHTDYNDGFAMPMALPFDTVVAFSSEGDPVDGPVSVRATGFGEVTFDAAADPRDVDSWARYVAGVVHLLRGSDVPSGGWRATIDTDIPTGASLSSSAAIEVAVISAILRRNESEWSPIEIARLGQRVENEVVGVPSGIMDQYISAGAVAGHASLMDCRELTLTPAPIPDDVAIVVMDSGTRRVLTEGAYADRRAACERAVEALGVEALRDATVEQLGAVGDETDRRRAHHVVTENARTLEAADALRRGDSGRFGTLMSESHTSLRDDFEVSGPGLDAIVDAAAASPGCLGARMTGGGFAGCAVALVHRVDVDAFEQSVLERYTYDDHHARLWVCAPSAGASVSTS